MASHFEQINSFLSACCDIFILNFSQLYHKPEMTRDNIIIRTGFRILLKAFSAFMAATPLHICSGAGRGVPE